MNLTALTQSEGPRRESLTQALLAVLRAGGRSAVYDDVNAALGLSFIITSVQDDPCPGNWSCYGRDFNLASAAKALGLRIRDLHPPDVSIGLDRAPEYEQHFDASYRPLIERALEHGQPVIAWCGWPAPNEQSWGLLTSIGGAGLGYSGVMAGAAQPASLVGLPIQLYVVEDVDAADPTPSPVWEAARAALARVASGDVDPRVRSRVFSDTYERWGYFIRSQYAHGCQRRGHSIAACHHRLATTVADARRSAAEFLRARRDCVPPRFRPQIDGLATSYSNLVLQLADSCALDRVSRMVGSLEGLATLRNQVQAAAGFDRSAWKLQRELPPPGLSDDG